MYKIVSSEGFMYEVRFFGALVRRFPALQYDRVKAQVDRANELFNQEIERYRKIRAARHALSLCGKLGKSRERLTKRTMIALNKVRAYGC